MPTLKQTLADLKGDRTLYWVALEYAKLKDGEIPERRDKYLRAVRRMLENPGASQLDNLKHLFKVFDVDIEAAIVIAASQAKPKD